MISLANILLIRLAAHRWALLAPLCLCLLCSCYRDPLGEQPRYNPQDSSDFFNDQTSARLPVAGTVPHKMETGPANPAGGSGTLAFGSSDQEQFPGQINGVVVDKIPFPITDEVMQRGHERYNIFCAVCHGESGYGNGMIVQRGFRVPPSFHLDRLRQAPVGHFYEVISHGSGAMYDYADRISPQDRWAIVAYVRALQLSQHADLTLLNDNDQKQLAAAPATQPVAPVPPHLGGTPQ